MSGFKGIVKQNKTQITEETLKEIFPNKKNTITDKLVQYINDANSSEDFNGDEFLSAIISYSDILSKGSYSIKEYVQAVRFCAYLIAENDHTIEAYKKARAEDDFVKVRAHAVSGSPEYNALSSAASRYRQTPLVKELLTVSQMPLYLMFQGERYRAVEVLAREMHDAAYSKDRIAAADKLLTHVKPPENLQVELAVGPSKEAVDLSTQLSKQLADSVAIQRKLLEQGVSLTEATKLGIKLNDVIEVEVE